MLRTQSRADRMSVSEKKFEKRTLRFKEDKTPCEMNLKHK